MTHAVEILRVAQKQLARINPSEQPRIVEAIQALADEPRPIGCKKLSGRPAWRIRVGAYRIIYEIHDDVLVVLIIVIGHRKDVYR